MKILLIWYCLRINLNQLVMMNMKIQTYQSIHSFSGSFQDKSPHVSALFGNEQAVSILLLCSIHFVLVHHSVSGVTFASASKFD